MEEDRVRAYTTHVALMEAEYILCRDRGWETAREKVEKLVESRALEIVDEENLLHETARMKCERAISLGDCHTLALAEKLKGTAVFARQEDDLAREARKKTFPVKLLFLESNVTGK